MTYMEILMLVQERGEHILGQDTRSLFTDKHRYLRDLDTPETAWREDPEKGAPEKRYGRSGSHYVWKREELLPDPPAQFPEGT